MRFNISESAVSSGLLQLSRSRPFLRLASEKYIHFSLTTRPCRALSVLWSEIHNVRFENRIR